ncbi:MAG: GNAT family N-acetyltransferase [Candidatus Eremiobacteraeota bacterium]|nr:GNAT family N-acetyltransferase [Candidatus Eremiobacteraeota bacterium]
MTVLAPLRVDGELALHPRHGGDAAEMLALVERNRESLREWLTWIDATRTLGDVRRYGHYAQAQYESRIAFDFGIRSGGALVGAIGLHGFDWGNRSAQIGYWLVPAARGRGIITRSAAALVGHAFGPLEMHRLEIRCVVENERSRAVAERLGFTFEGMLGEAYLLHGAFRDIALYAKTASSGA